MLKSVLGTGATESYVKYVVFAFPKLNNPIEKSSQLLTKTVK